LTVLLAKSLLLLLLLKFPPALNRNQRLLQRQVELARVLILLR
jgi:hypothetical protein